MILSVNVSPLRMGSTVGYDFIQFVIVQGISEA